MKATMALMVLMLAACSTAPVYETRNIYTDPETPQGKTSVLQCQMAQSQCEQIAEMKQESCEQKNERKQADCKAKGVFCMDESYKCAADKSSCEKQYNRCFQIAGGKVKSETVCVDNCEKIKP